MNICNWLYDGGHKLWTQTKQHTTPTQKIMQLLLAGSDYTKLYSGGLSVR